MHSDREIARPQPGQRIRRLHAAALAAAGALWVVAGSAAWAEATPREARVAGQFYPADPAELRGLVTELLDSQPRPAAAHKPRILIVPHAGYPYSGPIAASGFRLAQGHAYDGVVVVGFTHRGQFPGSSVDTREAYATPLGAIPVDQDAVAFLQGSPGIGHVEEAHEAGEHSLEVELPFRVAEPCRQEEACQDGPAAARFQLAARKQPVRRLGRLKQDGVDRALIERARLIVRVVVG